MSVSFNRRNFLITSATAAAAFTIVPRHVLGGPGRIAPSRKLNIAGIGIGGKGSSDLKEVEATENIVALCDVDPENYAAEVIARYPNAKVYTDYREMLAERTDLDAVMIATPDHTHAIIAMAAIKAGKHVFCQKPLTHSVADARELTRAAREAGVVTQMGIQGHSGEGIRLICEWIWDGAIGKVREVEAWCSLCYYPWGHAAWSSKYGPTHPTDAPPVPKGMNWDVWLGPARQRPYHPAYHPMVWRCWYDFGSSMMCDRGVHTFDPIVTALRLGAPTSVDATSSTFGDDSFPLTSIVTYQFPARKHMPPVKLTWYDGTQPPRPPELEDGRSLPKEGGAIFRGSKGTLVCGIYGESPRLIPESKMKKFKPPHKTIPRLECSHAMEWVNAIKKGDGSQPGASFDYSGPLTEICQLGNLAKRVDTRIQWDAENMQVTNLPEANKYLRDPYREGWSL